MAQTITQKIFSFIDQEKQGFVVLMILWMIVQVYCFFHFGIVKSVDTVMYIEDAMLISEGVWPVNRNFWYSGYSLILYIIDLITGNPVNVIFLQIIFSGIAVVCIYKLTQAISGNTAAFIASFLYIAFVKIHQWNMIVYTDALFTSATVISLYLFYFAKNKKHYLIAVIIAILTVFIRPAGIGFFVALISYFLFDLLKVSGKHLRIIILSFFGLGIVLLANFVLQDYVSSFIDSYAKAEIIYPDISLNVNPPERLFIPSDGYPPLIQLLMFIGANPFYFIKITLIKCFLFLSHIKPYYSWLHNLMIGVFLYPVYYFMIRGFSVLAMSNFKVFVIVFLLFQTLSVSFTSENWDGRFLLPVLPYVFITASLGIASIGKAFSKVPRN